MILQAMLGSWNGHETRNSVMIKVCFKFKAVLWCGFGMFRVSFPLNQLILFICTMHSVDCPFLFFESNTSSPHLTLFSLSGGWILVY